MIESVYCPECQTHYGLRRERVRYGLRRARCFRCEGIFSIEDEVNRILAAGLPQESSALPYMADSFRYLPAEIEPPPAEPPVIQSIHLEPSAMEAVYQEPLDLDQEATLTLPPLLPEPQASAEIPEVMPDSLTLDDLVGAEEEILDKTLVDYRPPVTPMEMPSLAEMASETISGVEVQFSEAAPREAVREEPHEEPAHAGGGYSSARDAIDKLLGGLGGPPPGAPHSARATGAMDVEATLSALDDTLGGNKVFHAPPPAPPVPDLPVMDFDTSVLDIPEPLSALKAEAAPATVRLTREEILAAMAPPTAGPQGTQGMPAQNFPESHAELESTLIMLTPPPAPAAPTIHMPVAAPTSFMPVEASQDQNLYRVQAGTETLSNLTMEVMADMVLQGRLSDYNMVARQFSENWIEAGKVPALRPLFERVRRERMASEPPPAAADAEAPKRSLFGGLFGRKDG